MLKPTKHAVVFFLTKLCTGKKTTISSRATPVMALSDPNPFKEGFVWSTDNYVVFLIYLWHSN